MPASGHSPATRAGKARSAANAMADGLLARQFMPPADYRQLDVLYRQIRSVIDQLDGRRAQVFVESMIVEMDATKAAELGFQWQGLLGQKGDKYGVIGGTNFSSNANLLNLTSAIASGSSSNLPAAAGVTSSANTSTLLPR